MPDNKLTPVDQTVTTFVRNSDDMLELLRVFANSPERLSQSDLEFVARHLLDIGTRAFSLLFLLNRKITTCPHVRHAITPILPIKAERVNN